MTSSELLQRAGKIKYGTMFNFSENINFAPDDGENSDNNDNVTGDTNLGTGDLNIEEIVNWIEENPPAQEQSQS